MMTKVLLGYDGSDSARDALDFALDLARRYGAELHVLAVVRPPEFAEDVETEAVIENSQRHYRAVLAPVQARLAASGVAGKCELAVGHPAEQLLRYADAHAIDHIVVGHRGRSLFERWLIGSVARQVIAHARCAVTVVRK
jgi:nucleotide-binding universal stress UspA family protein